MANETQKQTVSLEELMVSNLAMADATVKLLIYPPALLNVLLRAEATQCNSMEVCYGSYQTLR